MMKLPPALIFLPLEQRKSTLNLDQESHEAKKD